MVDVPKPPLLLPELDPLLLPPSLPELEPLLLPELEPLLLPLLPPLLPPELEPLPPELELSRPVSAGAVLSEGAIALLVDCEALARIVSREVSTSHGIAA